ncbi:hypothetical protein B0H14DRAFT_3177832 [Mycena olivaceomarginata]|nr:hypothetical protein B0H14DRAFT_3177832 [Mycena olivaceomarginata]
MTRMRTLKQVHNGKREDAERINSEKMILDIEKANKERAFAGVPCTSEHQDVFSAVHLCGRIRSKDRVEDDRDPRGSPALACVASYGCVSVPRPQYGAQQTHSKRRDPSQAGGNGAGGGRGPEGTSDSGHGIHFRLGQMMVRYPVMVALPRSCPQAVLDQPNYKMPHQPDVPPQDPARTVRAVPGWYIQPPGRQLGKVAPQILFPRGICSCAPLRSLIVNSTPYTSLRFPANHSPALGLGLGLKLRVVRGQHNIPPTSSSMRSPIATERHCSFDLYLAPNSEHRSASLLLTRNALPLQEPNNI